MSLIHRARIERLEPYRFEFPDMFRWMFGTDTETGWMRVEEFVDGETLVVRAELPDIDPDQDVELTVEDGRLLIHAQREDRSEQKDKDGFRTEFRYGSFDRAVTLPDGAEAGDVTASYTDGILEIRIPLPTEARKPPATKVPVTRG
jgi:HSP20 family protein